jgi:hypothetical protein
VRFPIATVSLGGGLAEKLAAICAAGFGIEVARNPAMPRA